MPPNSLSEIRIDLYAASAPNVLLQYAFTSNQGVFQFDDLPVGEYLIHVAVPSPYVYAEGNEANGIFDVDGLLDGVGELMNYVKNDETVYISGINIAAENTSSVLVALVAGYIVSIIPVRITANRYEVQMICQSGIVTEDINFSSMAVIKKNDVAICSINAISLSIPAGESVSNIQSVLTNASQDIVGGQLSFTGLELSHYRMLLSPESFAPPIS
ncbi:MAG TPA: hypothetical protein DCL77_09005 [Prolixibacteraceae bacterium]|jgi:hypothetical protein|nr:hypothetical protein [Prolixibacteraceae bacterium]